MENKLVILLPVTHQHKSPGWSPHGKHFKGMSRWRKGVTWMAHSGTFIGFPESKVHIPKIRQIDHWSLIENYYARNTSNATKYKFQWRACLEWFPFFRHNIHIFFFFHWSLFQRGGFSHPIYSSTYIHSWKKTRWNRDSLPLWRWFCIKTLIVFAY